MILVGGAYASIFLVLYTVLSIAFQLFPPVFITCEGFDVSYFYVAELLVRVLRCQAEDCPGSEYSGGCSRENKILFHW